MRIFFAIVFSNMFFSLSLSSLLGLRVYRWVRPYNIVPKVPKLFFLFFKLGSFLFIYHQIHWLFYHLWFTVKSIQWILISGAVFYSSRISTLLFFVSTCQLRIPLFSLNTSIFSTSLSNYSGCLEIPVPQL